jgi:hypothetical protein
MPYIEPLTFLAYGWVYHGGNRALGRCTAAKCESAIVSLQVASLAAVIVLHCMSPLLAQSGHRNSLRPSPEQIQFGGLTRYDSRSEP